MAAVWAGVAGLGGAGIGGAAAAWGAWIGGRRTVEAAEKQARQTALAEHQAWQRQARYEAYSKALSLTEEMAGWAGPTTVQTTMELLGRLREAANAVEVLGPPEAAAAARGLLRPMVEAMAVHVGAVMAGESVPLDTLIEWDAERTTEMVRTHRRFRDVMRGVLERPPG